MPTKPFVSKLSPEEWAEARHLRAEGTSFADLGRRFGVHPNSVSRRAREEGWVTPGETAPQASNGRRMKVRRSSPATADIRRRLAQRLYKIVEVRIRKLELSMQKQLQDLEQNPDAAAVPVTTKDERDAFAALIESINQVTEMASEPALAADGRRKSAINPELTALSDDIDPDGLTAASEKDDLRARLAQQLAKVVGPA